MNASGCLSERVHQIPPSGIRRIFDLACANPDGIDLSIGDPDIDVPKPVRDEAALSIHAGFNHYVSTRGLPELREAIATELRQRKLSFEDLLITAGATGGYYLAMMAVVSPGDEVLIVDPYFVAYANVVIMCGGVPRFIDTYPDFSLRADAIEPLITDRTRAIVLNHPGNPTGVVYTTAELRMVAELAERHGLHVVSDEIYDQFVYSQTPFTSIANVMDAAIVISGFSKRTGITGWRLGYVSGPKNVIEAMATLQQYSYVCANSIAQKAAVRALACDTSAEVEKYRARRSAFIAGLSSRFTIPKSAGAFYLFPEAPGKRADEFVDRCIEKKVFVIPGNAFSQYNTHFRLSFAVSDDKIGPAIATLNRVADEMQR